MSGVPGRSPQDAPGEPASPVQNIAVAAAPVISLFTFMSSSNRPLEERTRARRGVHGFGHNVPETMPMSHVVAVVPAAGFSTRFGAAKLLADAGGVPVIARTLASLLDAG